MTPLVNFAFVPIVVGQNGRFSAQQSFVPLECLNLAEITPAVAGLELRLQFEAHCPVVAKGRRSLSSNRGAIM